MRALLQRVSRAAVRVEGRQVAAIEAGLLILLGVARADGPATAADLARRVAGLRIFEDEAGKTNRSVLDVGGDAIVVSQFTLYADISRGRRPGFGAAAEPAAAEALYLQFAEALRKAGVRQVQTGSFGARMSVELENDGPFTILVDTADRRPA
jgi:D-aminoacyl-tRNA deacylase